MLEEMDVMTWGRERDGWTLIAPAMGASARARASMAINARLVSSLEKLSSLPSSIHRRYV